MPEVQKTVSFETLKQSVSISHVLNRYGLLQRLHRSGDSLSGPCPLHAGHNPTQFRVSLSKNCWICFGDCQAGGSILDFVSRKEGVTIREAALLLQKWFALPALINPGCESLPATSSPVQSGGAFCNPPLRFRLHGLKTFHPYLQERGLSAATIQTFGLGYCTFGIMAGRIVIPIHNQKEELVAYAGRWPGTSPDEKPKYKLPRGFRKSQELFNVHRAIAARGEPSLNVVEGFFGCMAVWQAGFRRVVALMGSSISEAQKQLIIDAAQPSGRVNLLLDEDNAGRNARTKAREFLSDAVEVRIITFPEEGLQPDLVPPHTLCALLA
jgi:DNA primase